MKLLSREDFFSTFGCSQFEEEIRGVVNEALKKGELPNFRLYNLEITNCECSTDTCCWNEQEILERLKTCGVWKKIKEALI